MKPGTVALPLVFLFLYIGLAGCRAEPDGGRAAASEAPAVLPAPVQPVAAAALPAKPGSEGWLGVAVARRTVEVTAELDGQLKSLAKVGDPVEPGKPVAEIETREIHEQLASAQAALTALEAEKRRSEIELESVHGQYERRAAYKDLYPKEELDELLSKQKSGAAAVESAAARVAEERSRVAQLAGRLGHGVVHSPIRGTVAARYLDPGAIVRPGTPLVRLISAGNFVVRFAVPPEGSAGLHPGQRIAFRPDAQGVGGALSDLVGVISQVAPQVDAAAQMVFAEAGLELTPAQAARVQDGLVGTVRLLGAGS